MAENNTEVTKVAINDIGTEEDFIKAVDSTIKNFDDGDLVEGGRRCCACRCGTG